MGYIVDTRDDLVGIETRRESFNLLDLQRTWSEDQGSHSDHIIAYEHGTIEMTYEFLHRLLAVIERNPDDLQRRLGIKLLIVSLDEESAARDTTRLDAAVERRAAMRVIRSTEEGSDDGQ